MSGLGGPGLGGGFGGGSNTGGGGSNTGGGGNRGPGHGHGNRGSGGLQSHQFGNPTGMAISQAMAIYGASNLDSLKILMGQNPANTVSFNSLIDDSDTTTSTTTTNNHMTASYQGTGYGFDIDRLYQMIFGRNADAGGRTYWTDQFNSLVEGGTDPADAVNTIKQHLLDSQERLDIYDELATINIDDHGTIDFINQDPTYTSDMMAAAASTAISHDDIDDNVTPTYSDLFDEEGNRIHTASSWNIDRIRGLMDTIADMEANPTIEYVDQIVEVPGDTTGYTNKINSLQAALADAQAAAADAEGRYQTAQHGYDQLYAQAAYGERPSNMSVKGVKTQNELPGYRPKARGTNFFSRMNPLTTGSLNLA